MTTENEKREPVVILVRVSTDQQAKGSDSPQVQEDYLRQWAKVSNREVVAVYGKRTEGVSGTIPAMEREDTAAAIEHAIRLRCALAVYSLDRLGRDGIDLMNTGTMLVDKGANLIAPGDGINLALLRKTAIGKYLHWMMAGTAQLIRDLISEKTATALQSRKQNGCRAGSLPFGYSVDMSRPEKRLNKDHEEEVYYPHLIPNPTEQATIARAVELTGQGHTLNEVAEILASEGKLNRMGKPFAASRLSMILKTQREKVVQ